MITMMSLLGFSCMSRKTHIMCNRQHEIHGRASGFFGTDEEAYSEMLRQSQSETRHLDCQHSFRQYFLACRMKQFSNNHEQGGNALRSVISALLPTIFNVVWDTCFSDGLVNQSSAKNNRMFWCERFWLLFQGSRNQVMVYLWLLPTVELLELGQVLIPA